ncbi:MAG: tryptophan synthase subunit beta [bacterium]|nr:tryptophan synthase subunit beta [bacterium]
MSNDKNAYPVADKSGRYGQFGGRYAPEVLMPALLELEQVFKDAKKDPVFKKQLAYYFKNLVGRPSPLLYCGNLSKKLGGAQIYLKNEGANLTGAHKINHCVGQILLAKRMGKKRIICETGAGQHGLATATVCASFGFECHVYMGARDVERQRPNVFWIEQLGGKVIPVQTGGARLKDAVNAALKDWITNVADSHYLLGSCVGPHPFPEINRYFQSVISREIKQQMKEATGHLPNYVIACVGGGSNAAGAFDAFLGEKSVELIGVEAGGQGKARGQNAARFSSGKIGVVEGFRSFWLLDEDGQVDDTHSISAGLDYAGVGPLHAYLHETGRVTYTSATDKQVLAAFQLLARHEGILPALESSHAVAEAVRLAPTLKPTQTIVVNLSGRAEKDIFIIAKNFADENFKEFMENWTIEANNHSLAENKNPEENNAKKKGQKRTSKGKGVAK